MVFSPRFAGFGKVGNSTNRATPSMKQGRTGRVPELHVPRSARDGYRQLGRGGGVGDQVRLEQAQAVIAG